MADDLAALDALGDSFAAAALDMISDLGISEQEAAAIMAEIAADERAEAERLAAMFQSGGSSGGAGVEETKSVTVMEGTVGGATPGGAKRVIIDVETTVHRIDRSAPVTAVAATAAAGGAIAAKPAPEPEPEPEPEREPELDPFAPPAANATKITGEDCMPIYEFSGEMLDEKFSGHILVMTDSVYVWVGNGDAPVLGRLDLATVTRSGLSAATTLVGDGSEDGNEMAARLAKRSGKVVYLSLNVSGLLAQQVELSIVREFKALGLIKP